MAEKMQIHLKMCLFYKIWEMEDRKASCKQFVVNGLKHVKVLACSFKPNGTQQG